MRNTYVRVPDRDAVASIVVPFTWPEITSGAEAVAWVGGVSGNGAARSAYQSEKWERDKAFQEQSCAWLNLLW